MRPSTRHPADPRSAEVFRPLTGMIVCGAWVLLTLLWLVMEDRVGTRDLIVRLPAAAAAGMCVASVFWWPRVEVDDDGVTVHNILRTIRMPFSALHSVGTTFCLTLTDRAGHTFGSWAAPAAGRVRIGPGSRSYFPELDAARPTPVFGTQRSDANAVAVAIERHRTSTSHRPAVVAVDLVTVDPSPLPSSAIVTWAIRRLTVLGVCVAVAALLPIVI